MQTTKPNVMSEWVSTQLLSDSLLPPLSMEFSRQEYWSGIAILYSKESSQPRDQTPVSSISWISKQLLYH